MPILRVQHTLQSDSGLAEDQIVNTFHFNHVGEVLQADLDLISGWIHDFFNVSPSASAQPLISTMAATINPSGAKVTIYNLSDLPPRVPLNESTQNYGATGTTSLPGEVAVCLSYQAAPLSGVPQARRRGRVYIGPLNNGMVGTTGRPDNSIITTLRHCGRRLLAASNAAPSTDWVVYSQLMGTAADVVGGWVDNAFDTQRRRGQSATTRSSWDDVNPAA